MKRKLPWRPVLLSVLVLFSCSKKEEETIVQPIPGSVPVDFVRVNGQMADFNPEDNTFMVLFPTVTDFSDCSVEVTATTTWVYRDGQRVAKSDPHMDLSSPVTLRFMDGLHYEDYTIRAVNTGLPVVRISTPGRAAVTSKENWLTGAGIRIEQPDGTLDYEGSMSIRGRGNSTWNYPKKPYLVRLDEKSSVLGMPEHKRWILLANWKDRTLLRNDAALWLSRHTGLPYTVRGRFVEVEMNGKHVGNYYLCEQIRVNRNRVDIDKDNGYLLEVDTYFDEPWQFIFPSLFNIPWMVKHPDEEDMTDEAFAWVRDFIGSLETLMKDETRVRNHEYEAYFDVDTAIDYMFVEELTTNNDFYNTWPWPGAHSTYFYLERGGKLYSGPVWDFDYHTFCPQFTSSWTGVTRTLFYPKLLKDERFRTRMLERWAQQKNTLKDLPTYIDGMADRIRVSEGVNQQMWPISNRENGDEEMTFQQAVDRMKKSYLDKWTWMDRNIGNLR